MIRTKQLLMQLLRPSFIILFLSLTVSIQCMASEAVRLDATNNGNKHYNDYAIKPADLQRFKADGFVKYSDFGAKGDGSTDDSRAIVATHNFANKKGLSVKADKGATYYIGGRKRIAIIKTDTDFGTAKFIIDDTKLESHTAPVFRVSHTEDAVNFNVRGVTPLKRNQQKIDIPKRRLKNRSWLVTIMDGNVKRFIRSGSSGNNGRAQRDVIIIDKDGNIDEDTPLIWDFDRATSITGVPIDETTLTVRGGHFTTIANITLPSYVQRGMQIRRCNVVVDGLKHDVTGETKDGAPYAGFITISNSAYVTVQNSTLTGRVTVNSGTYDLNLNSSVNVNIINCNQTNDIHNRKYWGIMGSNYCKNIMYDRCELSRFDAHQGVHNATIRNSKLAQITVTGSGTLTVENSTVRSRSLVLFRYDYGSTWRGDVFIRNCVYVPWGKNINVIRAKNSGQHDYGYTCYMPERITIENLLIDDAKVDATNRPTIFQDVNTRNTSSSYVEKYPYVITKELVLKNVYTSSGAAVIISDNPFVFKDMKVIRQ